MNKFSSPFMAKSPLNQEREKSTIKNPKFLELTQEEKDKQHAVARENNSIHTYKGVEFEDNQPWCRLTFPYPSGGA